MKRNSIAKRAGALVLCAALTAGSLAVAAGAAQSSSVTAQLSPNISIVVDGTERTFYNVSGQEVHPITYNGTTYLPIRSIGELMGKNVNWDQSTLTVSLTSPRTADAASGTPDGSASARQIAAELHPEYTITVDGTARTFSDANGKAVYPLLYNGSIYLPIRAIGQLMGRTVSWNGTSSTRHPHRRKRRHRRRQLQPERHRQRHHLYHRRAGQGDRPEPRGPHRKPGYLRPCRTGSGRRRGALRSGV